MWCQDAGRLHSWRDGGSADLHLTGQVNLNIYPAVWLALPCSRLRLKVSSCFWSPAGEREPSFCLCVAPLLWPRPWPGYFLAVSPMGPLGDPTFLGHGTQDKHSSLFSVPLPAWLPALPWAPRVGLASFPSLGAESSSPEPTGNRPERGCQCPRAGASFSWPAQLRTTSYSS